MTLIKVNGTYINLDNVTSISPITMEGIAPGTMEIEFVGRQNEDWGSMWVEGEQAANLRKWLDRRASDLNRDIG